MSVDQSVEYTHQLPLDIRILIALSNSQTASLMYIYDTEFRKYAEPAFVQPFKRFVLITMFNLVTYEHKLNNRRLCYDIMPLGTLYDELYQPQLYYIRWYSNGVLYRADFPGLSPKKKYHVVNYVDTKLPSK